MEKSFYYSTIWFVISAVASFILFLLYSNGEPRDLSNRDIYKYQTETYYMARKYGVDLNLTPDDIQTENIELIIFPLNTSSLQIIINDKTMVMGINELVASLDDAMKAEGLFGEFIWSFMMFIEHVRVKRAAALYISYVNGELLVNNKVYDSTNFKITLNIIYEARLGLIKCSKDGFDDDDDWM